MRVKVYFGKVCAKHPELKGERDVSRHCSACATARTRKHREENQKAYLAYMHKWREKNREVYSAYTRKWYEENREAHLACVRKRYEENKEVQKVLLRKWREAFKAKHGVTSATYYRRLRKQKGEAECRV